MLRFFVAACFLLLTANCVGTGPSAKSQDILVVGDSVMSWNRSAGGDVGAQLQEKTGRSVITEATPGARLRPSGVTSIGGLSIQNQLQPGSWNWVVMNGGANDLGRNCGCTRCDGEIERLMSSDGANGIIPSLVRQAQGYGAQVIWIGYYQVPRSRAFRGCRPALVELERRLASFASKTAGFYFVDAEDEFDPNRTDLFAFDQTHPSLLGSELIADMVARTIRAQSE